MKCLIVLAAFVAVCFAHEGGYGEHWLEFDIGKGEGDGSRFDVNLRYELTDVNGNVCKGSLPKQSYNSGESYELPLKGCGANIGKGKTLRLSNPTEHGIKIDALRIYVLSTESTCTSNCKFEKEGDDNGIRSYKLTA